MLPVTHLVFSVINRYQVSCSAVIFFQEWSKVFSAICNERIVFIVMLGVTMDDSPFLLLLKLVREAGVLCCMGRALEGRDRETLAV